MGFETENFENRICKISYGSGDKKLGILCHFDVVGVNAEKWDTPPFKPIIKAGMIYGKSAHSAGPQNGINAATALLMLLAKIGGPDSVFEKFQSGLNTVHFSVKALVLPRSRQRFRSRD